MLHIGLEIGDLLRMRRSGMARYAQCLFTALAQDRAKQVHSAEISGWAPWRRLLGWPINPTRGKLNFFGSTQPRHRPDIFHATACVFPPWKSAIEIATAHDLFAVRTELRLSADEVRRRTAYIHRADRIICVSRFTRDQVHSLLDVPTSRTVAIPLAAGDSFKPATDEQQQRLRRTHGLPQEFLLFVGRDRPNKNLNRLITAYGLSGIKMPFYIAGSQSKDTRQRLTQIVREQRCTGSVRWLGSVSEADLPVLLSCASGLCLPSTFEGFGLPIVEAMACGTPVVTSCGSATEEAAGGQAILVDPESVESIAHGLQQVLQMSDAQRIAAREYATRRTWDDVAAETWRVYAEAKVGPTV